MFKLAILYILGNVLNKAIPFLLLPVLTYYITPEGFGVIMIIQLIISILTILISLNFNGAYLKYYYKYNSSNRNILLYNIIIYTFLNAVTIIIFIILVLYIFSIQLDILFGFDSIWIFVAMFIAISNSILALILVNYQINNNPIKYSLVTILFTTINVVITLTFIVYLNYGWEGRILGMLSSSFFLLLVSYKIYFKKKYSLKNLDIKFRNKIYLFGIPLLPHALSGILLVSVDRLFLNSMLDLSSVGIYSTAYQFGMIISIAMSAINIAWSPYFFRNIEKNNKTFSFFAKKIFLISIIMFFLVLLIIYLSKYIVLIFFDIQYHEAVKYIGIIAWGNFFEGLYIIISNFIFYYEKNIFLSYVTFLVLILNIILNFIFIKSFGIYGAALATLISYIIYFLLVLTYSIYLIKKYGKKND